jgi:GNAT superfamily N-acetyltransferase
VSTVYPFPVSFKIAIQPEPAPDTASWIIDRLIAFNESRAGSRNVRRFAIFAYDRGTDPVGGLLCNCHWNHLFVSAVFVNESHRRKGVGRNLLAAAENLALEQGCEAIFLDSFDFQAPGFYKKAGFKVFGVLNDYPRGHQRFFLVKPLGKRGRHAKTQKGSHAKTQRRKG